LNQEAKDRPRPSELTVHSVVARNPADLNTALRVEAEALRRRVEKKEEEIMQLEKESKRKEEELAKRIKQLEKENSEIRKMLQILKGDASHAVISDDAKGMLLCVYIVMGNSMVISVVISFVLFFLFFIFIYFTDDLSIEKNVIDVSL
jgi:flagellar motility protein MotE (MotC chaperone)